MISTTLRRVTSTALLTLVLGTGAGTAVAAPAAPHVPLAPHVLGAPTSDPGGTVRPRNGEVVRTRDGSGPGRVEIEGGATDAVLTLARGDRAVRSIYVRAGQEATVDGVPDGTYTVFVTGGHDWDDATRRFTRDVTAERWPGDVAFTTESGPDGTSTAVWTFTLTGSPEGNIVPTTVAEDQLPR